jgi:hypothetical protein
MGTDRIAIRAGHRCQLDPNQSDTGSASDVVAVCNTASPTRRSTGKTKSVPRSGTSFPGRSIGISIEPAIAVSEKV